MLLNLYLIWQQKMDLIVKDMILSRRFVLHVLIYKIKLITIYFFLFQNNNEIIFLHITSL